MSRCHVLLAMCQLCHVLLRCPAGHASTLDALMCSAKHVRQILGVGVQKKRDLDGSHGKRLSEHAHGGTRQSHLICTQREDELSPLSLDQIQANHAGLLKSHPAFARGLADGAGLSSFASRRNCSVYRIELD
eukprot:scaffold188487_cov14-Tisochrysis_lutea.AAC.1